MDKEITYADTKALDAGLLEMFEAGRELGLQEGYELGYAEGHEDGNDDAKVAHRNGYKVGLVEDISLFRYP